MNRLNNLIETINELLEERLTLDHSNGGYKVVKLAENNACWDLSQRGTKKEITFFLEGFIKALELTKRG